MRVWLQPRRPFFGEGVVQRDFLVPFKKGQLWDPGLLGMGISVDRDPDVCYIKNSNEKCSGFFVADFPSRPQSRKPELLVAESYDRDRVGWVFVLILKSNQVSEQIQTLQKSWSSRRSGNSSCRERNRLRA